MTEEGGRPFDRGRCLIECKDADVPTLPSQEKMLVHGDRIVSHPGADHHALKESES